MMLKARIREAVRGLYATKQRSLLALLGIVIGIGSVIAMMSVGAIVKQEALQQFKELGTDVLTIRYTDSSSSQSGSRSIHRGIRLEDVADLAEEVSSITEMSPWIRAYGMSVYAGQAIADDVLIGATESFLSLNKLRLAEGRSLSDLDFRRFYCVVGAGLAEKLRQTKPGPLVGESIKLAGRTFTIVGVLHQASASSSVRRFNANRAAFMPLSTAQRVFPQTEIRHITTRMAPDAHHTTAKAEIKEYFRRTAPDTGIRVNSAQDLIERMEQQMQLFALLLAAIGSICLIVGGVGIMNVMLVAVAERRKEIGIRRALGARQRDIQGQFLIESVTLSLVGGLFGIIAGVGATYIICRFFTDWSFLIDPASVLMGVAVASCVGVFFGFYPAYQAARLDPITALRAQ